MVLATNQISFTDDELPQEGIKHALPMHIMVKCENMIVSRLLIDNGLAMNVCRMSTIECLNMDTSFIRPTTMIIKAFDGTLREVQGEIELAIGIGPRSFMVNFQVIKVDSPYNMLLGRPWLHTAGIVASTLHRRLKFPSEDQLITIMAEEPLTIFKETSIPYIGANAFPEATFHNFELVSMISRASELESAWPSATLMSAKKMLKFGYQLGQGLNAVGHRNASLIKLPDNKGGFNLGYDPFDEELFQASKAKKRKCTGQRMSIPYIRIYSNSQVGTSFCYHNEDIDDVNETIELDYDVEGLEEIPNLPRDILQALNRENEGSKPNIEETEVINLADEGKNEKLGKIGVNFPKDMKLELIVLLKEFKEIFAWSYQDMLGLDTEIVVHRIPVKLECPPVRQALRRMKSEIVLKIKEEVEQQLKAGFLTVIAYSDWVTNIVPVPKKDEKLRMCVDYRDLNRVSPKDNFPLSHIIH
ncbi:uncharacterized protein LOC142605950 [Castanea sativa]|uniref:uncharacterized protein LOC142605950 n=1 Tax=Castanea sativa TaxID=21020 RepID=UPI003F651CC9